MLGESRHAGASLESLMRAATQPLAGSARRFSAPRLLQQPHLLLEATRQVGLDDLAVDGPGAGEGGEDIRYFRPC